MKCVNCDTELLSGYKLKMDNTVFGRILISKKKSVPFEAAICPNCGEIKFYVSKDNIDKIIKA